MTGILSLIFGVIGLIASYWYIGVLFCLIGLVLGIVGAADCFSEKQLPVLGILLSVLGIIMSAYFIVSDLDSGRLLVEADKFKKHEKVEEEDDFMQFRREGVELEQKETETVVEEKTDETEGQLSAQVQEEETQENSNDTGRNESNKEYRIGDTWTVDGQWKITIDSVRETADRNPYSEINPASVYIVTYTYENLGYEDESGLMNGLFVSLTNGSVVDSTGKMGYSYPGDQNLYAQETPVGARCEAEEVIGVDNPGEFKIYISKYDGNGNEQEAVFIVTP